MTSLQSQSVLNLLQMKRSTKQARANRLNALRSTGPRSVEGKRSSSVNATRHGLTSPVESSDWAPHLEPLALILEHDEGLTASNARELARRIVDYERNVQYQRERFVLLRQGIEPELVMDEFGAKSLELYRLIADGIKSGEISKCDEEYEDYKTLVQVYGFIGRYELNKAKRTARERVGNADRYLRRSANQLIKQLRSLFSS